MRPVRLSWPNPPDSAGTREWLKGAARLMAAVAGTGACAAGAAGLFLGYPGATSTATSWQGYDAVNVAVGLALLTLAPGRAQPMLLIRASLLAHLGYTYAYYVFGAEFNDLFLLHVVVFTASLAGLAGTVFEIDLDRERPLLGDRRPRAAATLLGGLGGALCLLWVYSLLDQAVTGEVPVGSRLVETEAVVHLGIALDLTVLVPWYGAAAVLLWRRSPAGRPAALVASVAGLLSQVSYLVALRSQVAAGLPGAVGFDPAEPVIVLVYAATLALLTPGRRSSHTATGGPDHGVRRTYADRGPKPTQTVPADARHVARRTGRSRNGS